jgi:hypothetical protein
MNGKTMTLNADHDDAAADFCATPELTTPAIIIILSPRGPRQMRPDLKPAF